MYHNAYIPIGDADGGERDDDGARVHRQANKLALLRPEQLVVLPPAPIKKSYNSIGVVSYFVCS